VELVSLFRAGREKKNEREKRGEVRSKDRRKVPRRPHQCSVQSVRAKNRTKNRQEISVKDGG